MVHSRSASHAIPRHSARGDMESVSIVLLSSEPRVDPRTTGHGGLVGEYQPRSSSELPSSPSRSTTSFTTSSTVPSPAPASPAPTQPDLTDRTPLPAPTPPAAPSPIPQARAVPPPVPRKPIIPQKPSFSPGVGARTSLGGAPRTSFGGGGGENCPRCSQVVYAAEAVLASGNK